MTHATLFHDTSIQHCTMEPLLDDENVDISIFEWSSIHEDYTLFFFRKSITLAKGKRVKMISHSRVQFQEPIIITERDY